VKGEELNLRIWIVESFFENFKGIGRARESCAKESHHECLAILALDPFLQEDEPHLLEHFKVVTA
jgi:hypothetical protein